MRSKRAYDRISAVLDEVEAAQGRFFASIGLLTAPELVVALEGYAFLMGRLDALIYELSSPFARPSGGAHGFD